MTATLIVPPADLAGREVVVRGPAYRHLFRVRRLAAGEEVRLVDGQGRARVGRVRRVGREAAWLAIEREAPSREPALRLALWVGSPRPERAAWLVEKCTEVGVAAVRFLASERAPRHYGASTLARLSRLAAAAVEQCGRAWLPEVSGVHSFAEVAALVGDGPAWILEPPAGSAAGEVIEGAGRAEAGRGPSPLAQGGGVDPGPAPSWPAAGRAALLVGPEGGFSAAEREALKAAGCRPLGLGPRTLRVETAAVVGAARLLIG